MTYKIEVARRKKTAEEVMNNYAKNGWTLDKLVMGDMATQFVMVFVKDNIEIDNFKKEDLDKLLTNYENIIKCPKCSNLMNKSEKECPKCGHIIEK